MTIRAALLDENGVYLRIDELADAADLTANHLRQITACDLPPGEYKWIADRSNPYGGAFWSLKWLERVESDKAAVREAAQWALEIERTRDLDPQARREARARARASLKG